MVTGIFKRLPAHIPGVHDSLQSCPGVQKQTKINSPSSVLILDPRNSTERKIPMSNTFPTVCLEVRLEDGLNVGRDIQPAMMTQPVLLRPPHQCQSTILCLVL